MGSSLNADRKFAEVTNLLYYSREIGTYRGDVDHSQPGDRDPSPPGFLGAWERLVGSRGVPTLTTRRGRKPRVPLMQVLPTLTFHVMQDTGTLAAHLFQLFRLPLADSSWSDRFDIPNRNARARIYSNPGFCRGTARQESLIRWASYAGLGCA